MTVSSRRTVVVDSVLVDGVLLWSCPTGKLNVVIGDAARHVFDSVIVGMLLQRDMVSSRL